MKNIIKIFIVLVFAVLTSYLVLTIRDFTLWCNKMQFSFINTEEEQLNNLDVEKIQYLGESIKGLSVAIEENFKGTEYEKYNSLGITIWKTFQLQMNDIVKGNVNMSLVLGVAITLAYIVITSSKISNSLKLLIGYFGIMIIFPPLYMYMYTGRLWDIMTMYVYNAPKAFYIVYTLIFVVMYVIKYNINSKFTTELNRTIKNNK